LNRPGETNFADFLEGSHHVAYSKSKLDAPVRAKDSILSPLCLFIETMPINKAVASGNVNRILTQKLHVQIANKPRSPHRQTEAELLSSSRPP
jgi:hypothetical protein